MSAEPANVTLRELSAEELPSILPLIEQHNSKLTSEEVHRRFQAMLPHGYKCIAAFQNQRMVGVAGYWVGAKFWCGEFLEADNVYVLPELRSAGIGAKLMDHLEEKAKQMGCKLVVLDSYVTYHGAHRFYIRRGYEITGYHFTRPVQ